MHWLRRPSRIPRGWRWTAAILMGALAITGLAVPAPGHGQASGVTVGPQFPSNGPGGPSDEPNPPTKSPEPPGAGNPTASFPSSPALQAEGYNLYQLHCSSCHGVNLNGIPGDGPSLRYVGAGPVDFYLSTGRMPLPNPKQEPLRAPPLFSDTQIDALIDYISSFGGPPAPTAYPSQGKLSIGLEQFTLHCAGCHQMVGRGGMFVGAWVRPRARRSRASATTTGSRSPAIAACAWWRSKSRRSRSPPARSRWPTAWW
jgi:mono/diheme cytochrome c family protein